MFVHGREAYRRNALLILYTFYKNVLYVTTQFFFGFSSAFSGQPLYEPFIYQMYNIAFTAIPIMYFALFDFEYEKVYIPGKTVGRAGKGYYLRDPELYRIGIECSCFGIGKFLRWVGYGLLNAYMTYIFCFATQLELGQTLVGGKDVGFWVCGHVVYGVAVIVANVVIVLQFNNFTGWGEILAFASALCYFTLLYLQSMMSTFP